MLRRARRPVNRCASGFVRPGIACNARPADDKKAWDAVAPALMLGVFSRYVLMSTFTWYDEVGAGLLGLGGVPRRRARRQAQRAFRGRRFAALATPVAIIAFSAVLIVQGLNFAELGWFRQTPVMGLPKAWVYAAMPVGGLLTILYSLAPLWRGVRAALARSR